MFFIYLVSYFCLVGVLNIKQEIPPVSLSSSVPELVPDLMDIKTDPDTLVTSLPSVFDPLPDTLVKEEKPNLTHHNDGNILFCNFTIY